MPGWRRDGDDLVLELRIQPRAARDGFGEIVGDRLKLRITAPPIDGKANARLIRFLAGAFGVTRSAVVLERGATGRDKRVRIRRPSRLPEGLGKA